MLPLLSWVLVVAIAAVVAALSRPQARWSSTRVAAVTSLDAATVVTAVGVVPASLVVL